MQLGKHLPVAALAGATGLMAWAGLGGATLEKAVGGSFERVLSEARPARQAASAPQAASSAQDLLKLSSTQAGDPLPFGLGRPVSTGDEITIAGSDGERRTLEVTEVSTIPSGTGGPTMLLVTCVTQGATGPATVRFVVEAAPPTTEGRPQVHRAL